MSAAMLLPVGSLNAQVQVAGTLYVDLRATQPSAGAAIWINQGTLGNFNIIGTPSLTTNVAGTSIPGVLFNGTMDAYQGPNSVADIDGAGDRSIEVWAYNPSLVQEETTVSWGHRGTTRRDMAFNFGNNMTWGAATHWADDVSWGGAVPSAGAWHHLVYTYSNTVVRVYNDGALANSQTLGGALDTFPGEPINLACQRDTASGTRSLLYSGYLNTVRIHGGVLSGNQVQSNYFFGLAGAATNPPATPTGLAATPGYDQVWLAWNASAGANRYSVRRATTSGGPYTDLVTNLPTSGYLDAGLSTGTNYFYVVSAANLLGESTNSNPVSATPGVPSQPFAAGTVYVDLRATNSSAGSATWINQGTLGNFSVVGAPGLTNNVGGSAIPGVYFNGTTDAYLGPNSVPDIDGGGDRSIEVWAYNPSLAQEETPVSWGHRGTTRRNMGFNFGNNAVWGAATHWADDVSWGTAVPSAGAWHHLVYTYSNSVVSVYVDGALANSQSLGGALDTFPGEPINLGCQREADGTRSLLYSGYLNTVRIHGGVLNPAQIQANYYVGPSAPPMVAVNDSITMNPGIAALIPVLANDFVPSLFPASVILVSPPSAGTAQARPNGRILYTHNGGSAASDQFTYAVQNSLGQTSGVATVFVTLSSALRLPNTTITVPNSPPPLGYQSVEAFPGLIFTNPLAVRTPSGAAYSNMLFVCERNGTISYVPDVTAATPIKKYLVSIRDQIAFDTSNPADGELGLLSVDFHPGFATNGIFFLYYTAPNGSIWFDRLSKFTADPVALTCNTNTQVILFNMVDREFNHNGGDLHFGLDGYLYVSMGDEGGQYNVHLNAQRLDLNLYAGILRLDVDKKPGSIEPTAHPNIPTDGSGHAFYSIPPNNPFLGVTNYYGTAIDTNKLRAEFFAIGFRHPWRFSIDPITGEIWVGNVGQDNYEAVYIIHSGGNYGWPYYEATHLTTTLYPGQPGMLPPPAGYVLDPPLYEYSHTGPDSQFTGLDVNGSLPYHGSRIPQLTNAYLFGDFDLAGNVWALRRTNNTVTVERLMGEPGSAAFGADPSNGDLLMCNYLQNKIKRLIFTDATVSTFPSKLSDTGIFSDTTALTPNPGVVNYEPIVAFWSDYAIKRRWFCVPDVTNKMNYATDANWTFPARMKWIKHFDLELERDNPATKKRIETRVLVKTTNGVYGVSYQWNDTDTEAFLVADGGTNFNVNVLVGSTTITQQWEIPSRSSCLACHTPVGGLALSFNTRELNRTTNMNAFTGNQLALLSQAGYLDTTIAAPQTLPAFATATDAGHSLEYRARSYFAMNCVQCHQPGGSGTQTWDARPWLTLDQTHLINGVPDNNAGNSLNKLIVPGDTNHSVVLQRIRGNGFSRMPPLATHQLDQGAIALLTTWISTELTNHQSFADWQIAHFGSTNAPNAAATADPDGDGANNYLEYLTQTDPQNPLDVWRLGINVSGGFVNVSYPQVPNLGIVIDTSSNLFNWTPWDVSGNQPFFGSSAGTAVLQAPLSLSSPQYFRARLIGP